MLLLSADTSGKQGSIALAQCGPAQSCEVLEVIPLTGGAFSAQLVPQIALLLAKHGFAKPDIGGFAVVSGPGSFTGLRVGLAAVKALAEVLDKPIAAISLLEAVAVMGRAPGKVLAALDAGRHEIYAVEYEIAASVEIETEIEMTMIEMIMMKKMKMMMKMNGLPERLLTRDEFLVAAQGVAVITPDANVAEWARGAGLQVTDIERPGSDTIARLGWRKILAGETVLPENLEANYLRRSDAEGFAKPAV
jgi:tRNA threonylcarbamoyladenosine biosynthesis protein TsaB